MNIELLDASLAIIDILCRELLFQLLAWFCAREGLSKSRPKTAIYTCHCPWSEAPEQMTQALALLVPQGNATNIRQPLRASTGPHQTW
jgi:hypothetical protein